jgi:hypothetical protein
MKSEQAVLPNPCLEEEEGQPNSVTKMKRRAIHSPVTTFPKNDTAHFITYTVLIFRWSGTLEIWKFVILLVKVAFLLRCKSGYFWNIISDIKVSPSLYHISKYSHSIPCYICLRPPPPHYTYNTNVRAVTLEYQLKSKLTTRWMLHLFQEYGSKSVNL